MNRTLLKKRKVITILVVCFLIILAILSVMLYSANAYKRQTAKGRTPVINTKEDGVLNIGGFGVFFEKYTGQYTSSEIAEKIGDIVSEYLPNVFEQVKDLDEEGLKNYYSENSGTISVRIGNQNYGEFKTLIETLKGTKIDLNTHYRMDALKETFVNDSDRLGYAYVIVEVTYKNDETIQLGVYVAKAAANQNKFIIVPIEKI